MRHTDEIKVTVGSGQNAQIFSVSAALGREVERFISSRLQDAAVEKLIPAEKVLPELADDVQRPATMLRGSRYKVGMTQKELAKALDIRQHHLSEMENSKRPIGKNMAKRLADVLDCDYRLFV